MNLFEKVFYLFSAKISPILQNESCQLLYTLRLASIYSLQAYLNL